MRFKGTVKWFNSRTGVGAILLGRGDDVIVETTAVFGEVDEPLTEGDIVEFEPIPGATEPHPGEEALLHPGEEVLLHGVKESQLRKVRIQTSGHPIKLRDVPTASGPLAESARIPNVSGSDQLRHEINDFGPSEPGKMLIGEMSSDVPITSQKEASPSIPLFIDPGEASTEQIRDVLSALNQLDIAAGGLGFTFDIDGTKVVVLRGHHV